MFLRYILIFLVVFSNASFAQPTAAIDNLTNAVILPQLGLPQPGRSIRIGLIVGG